MTATPVRWPMGGLGLDLADIPNTPPLRPITQILMQGPEKGLFFILPLTST